jgi:sulfur relay (sulfurtransferase) complex TusBCD TusD component (DsrE family)
MNFLNPLALFGLLAGAIPIVIHFLNLRKLKIIEFSTLKFLKELQKTKIRRLKIKQILLLILRTSAVIFAVLALARPAIEGTIPGFSSYTKTSAIIIIDNSFSMDVSDESGNRMNQARNSALSILNELKEGDEAAIIEMTDGSTGVQPELTRNISFLKEQLSKMNISYKKGNLNNALRIASGLIDKATNINQEIFIISDAQSNIFYEADEINSQELADKKIFTKNPAVYYIKIGANSDRGIANASIDSISVLNRIFQFNKNVEVEVSIRNGSDKPMNNMVVGMYFNKDRVAQRNIDIPANETRLLTITASPQQYGLIRARVALEDDALNIDNERHFGFVIPDKPRCAVFGKTEDVTFINMVLGSDGKIESPANVEFFEPNRIQGVNLSDYEIVFCAGGPYSSSDFAKIRQFVSSGGSCLIFADSKSDQKVFADGVSSLGLGELKQRDFPDENPGAFINVEKIHPIFEGVFKGTTDSKKVVESASVFKALANNGGLPLITMTGGNFLSENKFGEGKVLYLSVAPLTTWSSFPLTGLFPTLLYRSVIYLSAREGLGRFAVAGDKLMISLATKYSSGGNIKISDPNNNEIFKELAVLPSGSILQMDDLNLLGVYSIYSPQNRVIDLISVNPPTDESFLKSMEDNKIIDYIKTKVTEDSHVNIITDNRKVMTSVNRLRSGTELWQLFILLALACLITEMFVAKSTKQEVVES